MKLFPTLAVLLLLGSMISCKSDAGTDSNETEASATPAVEINEDELIARLSGDYITEPSTRNEHDRNAIIDYAIKELLPVKASPSGLYFWVQEPGTGDPGKWGQRVSAHYTGRLLDDGRVFDDSRERGRPMSFTVGNMIPGFNEAMMHLGEGGKAVVLIPSALAYGDRNITDASNEEVIPANAVLRFDIERVK